MRRTNRCRSSFIGCGGCSAGRVQDNFVDQFFQQGEFAMTVKVQFVLDINEYDFPPVRVESIDATEMAGGLFRLESAAYFVEGVAYHDVVHALPTEMPGQFEFVRVVGKSDFVPMSVILFDDDVDEAVMTLLRVDDCVVEYGEFDGYRMLAVAVPPGVAFEPLREQLLDFEELGRISVAELNRRLAYDA
jgi:hypothetical protein